jgi:hypothetical protein
LQTFEFVTACRPLNINKFKSLHAVAKQNTASACSNKFKSLHAVTKQNTACSNKFKGLYTVTNLKVHETFEFVTACRLEFVTACRLLILFLHANF